MGFLWDLLPDSVKKLLGSKTLMIIEDDTPEVRARERRRKRRILLGRLSAIAGAVFVWRRRRKK